MTERILITGASGFVGYHLIEHAVNAGLEVFAAIRKNSDVNHLKAFKIQYVELDYTSVTAMAEVLQSIQCQYIVHAAGSTKAKTLDDYNRVNAAYTRNLALAVKKATLPLKKFVFISSLAALGPLKDLTLQINDDALGVPVTNYGASKLLAEKYLSEIEAFPLITIRPTAVYGPREKDLFILFKSISRGLEPYIGNFKQQLSFVYVKDLAAIIISALFSNVEGKTYNVSDGNTYDRYALAVYIKKAMHKKTFMFHLPIAVVGALASVMDLAYRNSKDTPTLNKEKMAELTAINWACNIDRVKKDLGYAPKYNLEKGLAETVLWYKENRWI
ncbi:MAG: NAD(P)-dependent oxidoreductase [Pedobacter sp.]|nr:MAG: NAD(P)-dependent oxidoreductase [Pedobacter sp.]